MTTGHDIVKRQLSRYEQHIAQRAKINAAPLHYTGSFLRVVSPSEEAAAFHMVGYFSC